jgi:hypothetical protein
MLAAALAALAARPDAEQPPLQPIRIPPRHQQHQQQRPPQRLPAPPPLPQLARLAYSDLAFELGSDGQPAELPELGPRALAAAYHFQPVTVRELVGATPAQVAALQRQALLHACLSHDNVVRVLGVASNGVGAWAAGLPGAPLPRHALVVARIWRSLQGVIAEAAAVAA